MTTEPETPEQEDTVLEWSEELPCGNAYHAAHPIIKKGVEKMYRVWMYGGDNPKREFAAALGLKAIGMGTGTADECKAMCEAHARAAVEGGSPEEATVLDEKTPQASKRDTLSYEIIMTIPMAQIRKLTTEATALLEPLRNTLQTADTHTVLGRVAAILHEIKTLDDK